MTPTEQPCALCARLVPYSARYPHYVCSECAKEAADEQGRPIELMNWDNPDGFMARYRDTGELRESHDCYIRGVKCWAGEAYMGGVVVRLPYPDRSP